MGLPISKYRHPDYLTVDDEPRNRVRCPIHGFIHYSDNERHIIDHALFRRLRHIRQLALTEYIYPGAVHTRFEHSLGVMDVATRAFDSLAVKHGDLLEATFKTVADFEKRPLALAREYLRLAALLHDVGHASFSHAAEKAVNKGIGHEALTLYIVREKALLGRELSDRFAQDCPERIAQIIQGGRDMPPQLQILHDLVSGEMDADRTDYLLRDSHHCGVEYGRFDFRRMLECLELVENDLGGLEVALNRGGLHTFEALILARYQMNTQVYYHRLRRIYDLYLIEYHKSLGDEVLDTPEKVIAENDITMIGRIMGDARDAEDDRTKWAKRLCDRNHHRQVHETGVDASAEDVRRSQEIMAKARSKYSGLEFLGDVANGRIHKLLTREDESDEGLIKMPLVGENKKPRHVGYESQVLSRIPREFQCSRIFADVSREQNDLRQDITEFLAKEWREGGGN